jgi:hypothetical protein
VRRAGGDSIDIQWREIDDLSLRLGPREPNDLAGEIYYNSDDFECALRISIKNESIHSQKSDHLEISPVRQPGFTRSGPHRDLPQESSESERFHERRGARSDLAQGVLEVTSARSDLTLQSEQAG